ncbi:Lectin-domain containing receptor kinase A4.3 [Hordeum vulgare]|nr:Lectin-domain containing receptor kinase A4.3 [Hordeum vulgare]
MQPAFMQDLVGLDLNSFPLDHVFSDDYDLQEEDEVDIDGEPLFEDKLANQATGVQPKRKSRRTKAYTTAEDKLLCECWRDIGQDPKVAAEQKASIFWIRVHREFHECKKFPPYQMQSTRGWVSISKRWKLIQRECNKFYAISESIKADPAFQALVHCWRIIKDEEKFKLQYVAPQRMGKEAVVEVREGEKPRSRVKNNFKKEDKAGCGVNRFDRNRGGHDDQEGFKRGETPTRQGRENERLHGDPKEWLEMEAEKQARMLEMEAEKQAKMLEIEAANAKTKTKEVALA